MPLLSATIKRTPCTTASTLPARALPRRQATRGRLAADRPRRPGAAAAGSAEMTSSLVATVKALRAAYGGGPARRPERSSARVGVQRLGAAAARHRGGAEPAVLRPGAAGAQSLPTPRA